MNIILSEGITWVKTYLVTALVAYLDATIEASLMGLHTLCDQIKIYLYYVFQRESRVNGDMTQRF